MAIFKNLASQKLAVFAYDNTTGLAKTGDAANITAGISKDGGSNAATNDTNPTELDATNHPGVYLFDLTQAETNADLIAVSPKSSTTDIKVRPLFIYTFPRQLKASSSIIAEGTVDSTSFTPTTTQFESDDITEATADHFKDRIVIFTSGALIYQGKPITAYSLSGSNGKFTVGTLTEAPANDDTFVIL